MEEAGKPFAAFAEVGHRGTERLVLLHRLHARAIVLAARDEPAAVAVPELVALAEGDLSLLAAAAEHGEAVAAVLEGHPTAERAVALLHEAASRPALLAV